MDTTPVTIELPLRSSRDEAGNVRTFVFDTGGLSWIAGQAQAYVLAAAGESEDENQRWFTIASAPSEGAIHISTRVSSSRFKQTLNAMRPGDRIVAHSLEGDFTWEDASATPVVLVAGGIGVTPFRSILLERQSGNRPLAATLLYFNRPGEIPFRRELEELTRRHPSFSMRVIEGEPITADRILQLAPESRERVLYLSGAEPMVESVGGALRDRGVEVKQDWFPGYDERTY
jgi:ferredoxin-NADP reductase